MRGSGDAGGAMTDAWTVGWWKDYVALVLVSGSWSSGNMDAR